MGILRDILVRRGSGGPLGLPSFCTANPLVLEAVLGYCARHNLPALVEATANQVNQFGGYTGMKPADFAAFVRDLARKSGLPEGQLILGGDHLGPLTWASEPEASAMEKGEALVALYAAAGFSKLHLDTSMRLGDDDPAIPLPVAVAARRGARLARAALNAWRGTEPPAFIIGSEVPIPGGASGEEDGLSPTTPEALDEAITAYRAAFEAADIADAWPLVAAVVVQPGVEFSGTGIHPYDSAKAAPLMAALGQYEGLVFEGHSTDYQPLPCLQAMAQDGVALLKVGPEVTLALREALFALSFMEDALSPDEPSRFRQTLEAAMVQNPAHWRGHYGGSADAQALQRQYSLSDRCRYYMAEPEVKAAQARLLRNIDAGAPPMGLVRQFLPLAAPELTPGDALPPARELVIRHVESAVLRRYFGAVTA